VAPVGATADEAEFSSSIDKTDTSDWKEDNVRDEVIIQIDNYSDLENQLVWQGQEIQVNLSDSSVQEGDTITVYERVEDGSLQLADQLIADKDGVIDFNATYSSGDYFLTGAGDLPTQSEGQQNRSKTFQIAIQTLSAEFNRDIVTDGGPISTTEFDLDSNRATYPVTIHANNKLTPDELLDIFVNNGPFTAKYIAEGNEGVTDFDEIGLVNVTDSDQSTVDFREIDSGDYNFSFVGTDTTPEASDNINVQPESEFNIDPTATFTYEPEYPEPDQPVAFNANESDDIDGNIVKYRWDFNGDGIIDKTGVKPSYTYDTNGFYEVSLTTVDNDGGTSSATHLIEVAVENQTQNPETMQEVSRPPHIKFQSYDKLLNRSIVWRGQEVQVNLTEYGVNTTSIQIRKKSGDNSLLVKELTAKDGIVTFETSTFSAGDYFLYGPSGLPDPQEDASKTFQITEQSFTADFESVTVDNSAPNSTTQLEFDSNRARYPVTVTTSEDRIHAIQLARLFESATINGNTAFDVIDLNITGKDEITMTANGTTGISDSDQYEVDFSGANISAGEYEFVFSVADSTAEDSTGITVTEVNESPVKITNVDLSDGSVTESPSTHTLTIDVKNISADGEEDEVSIDLPENIEFEVIEATVTNSESEVNYSTNGNEIVLVVDPNKSKKSLDLTFSVDMSLSTNGS
jgi:PKD repeat protein